VFLVEPLLGLASEKLVVLRFYQLRWTRQLLNFSTRRINLFFLVILVQHVVVVWPNGDFLLILGVEVAVFFVILIELSLRRVSKQVVVGRL